MSYYFLYILGYYIKLSTEIGPNSNVTESTVRKIKQLTQKFWKEGKNRVISVIKMTSNERFGINICLISFQKIFFPLIYSIHIFKIYLCNTCENLIFIYVYSPLNIIEKMSKCGFPVCWNYTRKILREGSKHATVTFYFIKLTKLRSRKQMIIVKDFFVVCPD